MISRDFDPNPQIMQAVETLNYRVTLGDVAAQAGLDLNLARQGLLALAANAAGELQVAESGEVIYKFPQNFRSVLEQKFSRLRWQARWQKIWRVLFYLIRISFAIVLVLLIVAVVVAIGIVVYALMTSNRRSDDSSRDSDDGDGGLGILFIPRLFLGSPDFFWIFLPDYYERRSLHPDSRFSESSVGDELAEKPAMGFMESIFSFLFGDSIPNRNLEERRWQLIGNQIRRYRGALPAEMLTPYLDDVADGKLGTPYESYMLPVLTRFNGQPQVTPEGELIYEFPELQTTVNQRDRVAPVPYLEEERWCFSSASSGQIFLAVLLGVFLLGSSGILAFLLFSVGLPATLQDYSALLAGICFAGLGYSIAYLTVPLVRSFWIGLRNRQIDRRNQLRRARAEQLVQPSPQLQSKLDYARQFAAEHQIRVEDIVYTTETDLTSQELAQADRIDAEWQRRLEGQ